eukprot:10347049-Karenia_brevis.AAC.1
MHVWSNLVSSQALLDKGQQPADLREEQDKLISERIASHMKGSLESTVKGLQDIFATDRDWSCEDRINEVCSAITASVHIDEFSNLDDMLELAASADGILKKEVADNTQIGYVFTGWPNGKRIIQHLQGQLFLGQDTKRSNEELGKLRVRFQDITAAVESDGSIGWFLSYAARLQEL